MATLHFPFRCIVSGRPANAFLPVRVTNPHNGDSADAFGLIDTGAAECCIPDWLALQIGHDLAKGVHPVTVQTASGQTKAAAHTVTLAVIGAGGQPVLTVPAFRIRVLPGLPFVSLGVAHFLESRRLTVDYPSQAVGLA